MLSALVDTRIFSRILVSDLSFLVRLKWTTWFSCFPLACLAEAVKPRGKENASTRAAKVCLLCAAQM